MSDSCPSTAVLVMDDEPAAVRAAQTTLHSAGISPVLPCTDSRQLMSLLAESPFGVLLLDLSMPYMTGEQLLPMIAAAHPGLPVIVCTGANDVETAVTCMKAGAFDYMVKPIEESRLISGVRRALEMRELQQELSSFKQRVLTGQLDHPEAFEEIVTAHPKMRALFQYAESIARTTRPILITGETGSGKELLARAIHALSGLEGPFVALNVAGLDDQFFTDTLFGHRKGAFTGADEARPGLIANAAGGTLFLDEIGDLSLPSQVKLLRLLQDSTYLSLGADMPKLSSARIVAATNRDLKALMSAGKFRNDLYYRLDAHNLHLPPLRERREDLGLLLDHFLEKAAVQLNRKKPSAPRELVSLLALHSFPGNVRELESMVFDAVSRHESHTLSMDRFRQHILPGENTIPPPGAGNPFESVDPLPSLKEAHRLLIEEAMRRCGQNQTLAARLLGISQPGLSKALKNREQ